MQTTHILLEVYLFGLFKDATKERNEQKDSRKGQDQNRRGNNLMQFLFNKAKCTDYFF